MPLDQLAALLDSAAHRLAVAAREALDASDPAARQYVAAEVAEVRELLARLTPAPAPTSSAVPPLS